MPDLNDHDLLIEIRTTLNFFLTQTKKDIDDLRVDVNLLKAAQSTASGFAAGQKAIWALLGGIPPGLVAVLLGLRGAL